MVADQQQLRPRRVDVAVDRGQGGGVGHRGLVDHDQVPGVQPPRLVALDRLRPAGAGAGGEPVLGGQPAGDVAGGQAFAGEDVGGDLGGGQPEHPPRRLRRRCRAGSVQRAGERADDERLAGAGRPDQGLDPGAGGEHPAHGGGLVDAELDPGLAQPVEEPGRDRVRQRRRAAAGGGGDQGAFGAHVLRGGVQRASRAPE